MPGFPEIDFVLFPVRTNTERYAIGVGVGSVTNWTIFNRHWQMWLYCTSDKNRGYRCAGGGVC
jgi:hypothetical protein